MRTILNNDFFKKKEREKGERSTCYSQNFSQLILPNGLMGLLNLERSITQILGGPLKFPKDLQVLGKCLERKINKFWNHSKYTQKIFQTQILIPPKIQTHFCTETLWYPCLPHANLCIFHLHTNSELPGTVHNPGRVVQNIQKYINIKIQQSNLNFR